MTFMDIGITIKTKIPEGHQCGGCTWNDYGIMKDGKDFCNLFRKELNCTGTEYTDKGKRVSSFLIHFKCQDCLDACKEAKDYQDYQENMRRDWERGQSIKQRIQDD